MRVWRIASGKYASFDGEGARLAGGRWNLRGTPLVYTSGSLALSVLEYTVNVDSGLAPSGLVSIEAEIPDAVKITRWRVSDLPANWSAYPPPETLAMRGTEWAESGSVAVLAVPSAVVPDETNFLINPRHPDFRRIVIRTTKPFRLDPRLLKK